MLQVGVDEWDHLQPCSGVWGYFRLKKLELDRLNGSLERQCELNNDGQVTEQPRKQNISEEKSHKDGRKYANSRCKISESYQ